jgi:uncharacterized protein (TIGR03435 family)
MTAISLSGDGTGRLLSVYERRIAEHGLKLAKAGSQENGEMDAKDRQGFYAFHHVTMPEFAQQIRSLALDRPVLDHRGLPRRYDMTPRFPAGC